MKRVKTPRNSPKIQGYGYPRYDVEPTGNGFATTVSDITIAVHELGELSGIAQAMGVVIASSLNVRTLPGAEHSQLKSIPCIPQGTIVNICDAVKAKDGGIWYYVQIRGKYGFVSSKYIQLQVVSSGLSDNGTYQDGTANYSTR